VVKKFKFDPWSTELNKWRNTQPVNKMTVDLKAIMNQIFNKIQQNNEKYDGYDSAIFWVRVSQFLNTDLFSYTAYFWENTLPVNKMTAIIRMEGIGVKLRAIMNEIFNKYTQKHIWKYDWYDSAKSGYGSANFLIWVSQC